MRGSRNEYDALYLCVHTYSRLNTFVSEPAKGSALLESPRICVETHRFWKDLDSWHLLSGTRRTH
jgi:hypothetical protein